MAWTATITPSTSDVTLDVAADSAEDIAGNGNAAAQRTTVRYEPGPLATIAAPTGPVNGPFTATLEFGDGTVDVTGFTAGDVTNTTPNRELERDDHAGCERLGDPRRRRQRGPEGPGRTRQPGGGPADGGLRRDEPTVTIGAPVGLVTGPFTATFEFSETVTGFTAADIAVGSGAASDVAGLPPAGRLWTATITPAVSGDLTPGRGG